VARAKLRAMVAGTAEVRQELNAGSPGAAAPPGPPRRT
jgi:hypothetical protein